MKKNMNGVQQIAKATLQEPVFDDCEKKVALYSEEQSKCLENRFDIELFLLDHCCLHLINGSESLLEEEEVWLLPKVHSLKQ